MKVIRLSGSLFLFLLLPVLQVAAQTNVNEEQGLKPYESLHGGDLDSVSLTNGSLLHHIPLVCFPQRGSLNLCFSVYSNTKNWQPVTYCTPDSGDPTGWNCSNTKWEPIKVNAKERFYTNSDNQLPIGKYLPGSHGARMIILLHELAHKVKAPGITHDAFSPYMSEKNTQRVIDHCEKAIDGP